MKIALMCPSRQRLNNIITLISSIMSTAHDIKNINLVLAVDDDDPKFEIYKKIATNVNFIQFIKTPASIFKQKKLSGMWNYMYSQVTDDIVAMIGDDMIFETPDWDLKIINTFKNNSYKDNIIMVHCNDGMRGAGNTINPNVEPLAVNSFIHRDYTNLIGRYVQDIEPNIFQDTYIHTVFSAINRRIYYHDIMIRHLHFSVKGKMDKVSEQLELDRSGIWDNSSIWKNIIVPEINKEVKILTEYINSKKI